MPTVEVKSVGFSALLHSLLAAVVYLLDPTRSEPYSGSRMNVRLGCGGRVQGEDVKEKVGMMVQ